MVRRITLSPLPRRHAAPRVSTTAPARRRHRPSSQSHVSSTAAAESAESALFSPLQRHVDGSLARRNGPGSFRVTDHHLRVSCRIAELDLTAEPDAHTLGREAQKPRRLHYERARGGAPTDWTSPNRSPTIHATPIGESSVDRQKGAAHTTQPMVSAWRSGISTRRRKPPGEGHRQKCPGAKAARNRGIATHGSPSSRALLPHRFRSSFITSAFHESFGY